MKAVAHVKRDLTAQARNMEQKIDRNHELLQQILKTLAEASVPEPESGAGTHGSNGVRNFEVHKLLL